MVYDDKPYTYYCDRCGTQYTDASNFETYRARAIVRTIPQGERWFADLDLCPECEDELLAWMDDKKRDEA